MRTFVLSLLLLAGCAKPTFILPDAPTLKQTPPPPEVPRPQAVEGELDLPVEIDGVGVGRGERAQPLRLAVLPVLVDEATQVHMGLATARLIEDQLPRVLLEGGLSHFVGPDVLMEVPAEKQASRDGTVRWTAPLGVLMQVEPVLAADLLLLLEVRHARRIDAEIPLSYALDPSEAESYAARYSQWMPVAEAELSRLRSQRDSYKNAWAQAASAYEDRRGKYGGDEDEPTPGDLARQERDEVVGRLNQRISALERDIDRTPAPEDLARAVESRQDSRSKPAFILGLRARLVDARSLEVQWLADLSTRDDVQEDATRRVLEAIVDQVR